MELNASTVSELLLKYGFKKVVSESEGFIQLERITESELNPRTYEVLVFFGMDKNVSVYFSDKSVESFFLFSHIRFSDITDLEQLLNRNEDFERLKSIS